MTKTDIRSKYLEHAEQVSLYECTNASFS